jgi:hypothetical protein
MSERRCGKGKPCGLTCIEALKVCKVGLPSAETALNRVQGAISKETRPEFKIGEDSKQAAREILSKYIKSEPRTTALLSELAKKNEMELVGLKHRLKSEESLARKIESEKDAFGGSARRAAQSMSDVNRYTMQVPPEKYGDAVKDVLEKLREEGYTVRIKNYWSPDAGPYRGMNVALTHTDGRKIELQFHTEDSLKVKHKTHKDYEEFRISKDNKRRKFLWDRMVRLSRTIPMPEGAMEIGGRKAIKILKFEKLPD